MYDMDALLESYVNGNIDYVKDQIKEFELSLGELLELYIHNYDPHTNDIILFVKRLEM